MLTNKPKLVKIENMTNEGCAVESVRRHAGLGRGCVLLCAVLQGCVYLPRTTQVFDTECRVMVNHMVLEGGQVAAIQQCANQGCVALIVGAGVVAAATFVISGTIVVAGNVAYWFEKKGRCESAPAL